MMKIGKFLIHNMKKRRLPRSVILIVLSSSLVISSLKTSSHLFPIIYGLSIIFVVLLRKILPPKWIALVSGNVMGSIYFAFIFFELLILRIPMVMVLLHLLVFLQLGKLLTFYSAQDLYFLILVSFGLILFVAVLSPGVITIIAFFLFLYGFLEFSLLTRFRHPLSGLERRIEASAKAHSFSTTLSFLFLLLICLSGTLYLILPRASGGMISPGNLSTASMLTGFSDNIELGNMGRIEKDSRVAMRVRTGNGGPLPCDLTGWRGTTMEYYDGRAWRRTYPGNKKTLRFLGNVFFSGDHTFMPGKERILEFFVEPAETNLLFLPARSERIEGDFPVLFSDPSGTVFTSDYYHSSIHYRVYLAEEAGNTGQTDPATEDYVRRCLRIPQMEPEILSLARKWTRGKKSALQKALAIEKHLASDYTYTLEAPSGFSGKTPLYDFLFINRAGHCEYFATAMAVLLRVTGVPTRLVAGYTTGEYNPVGSYYLIRQHDAHTWVEILVPGHGWVEFDPTPASALPQSGTMHASLLGTVQYYLDYAELLWSSHVMSYGMTKQLEVIRFFRYILSRFMTSIRTGASGLKENPQWFLYLSVPALLMAAGFLFWIRRKRKPSPLSRKASKYSRMYHPEAKQFARILKALEKRGRRRKPHETPLQYALSVEYPFRREFRKAAWMHNRFRFGKRSVSRQDSRFFEAVLSKICNARGNREGK